MLKPVIAATVLLAIAGSSYVYAQQRFDGPRGFRDGGPRMEFRHRLSPEDVSAFADARIAALMTCGVLALGALYLCVIYLASR